MTIQLRIVGVFYRADIDLGSGGGSVKDILDAAAKNDPSIVTPFYDGSSLAVEFSDTAAGSPKKFSATFTEDFTTPVLHTNYSKGLYEIEEQLPETPPTTPLYSVWQYYIFSKDNVYLNRGKGAIMPADAHVEDGQSVTLRLITIHANAKDLTSERLKRDYLV